MVKEAFIDAYASIRRIEDLFIETLELFARIPPIIKHAMLDYHNDPGTIQHCLRYGLHAAKEIREDWHPVVSGIPCGESEVIVQC